MRTHFRSLIGLFVVAIFLTVASSARADQFDWTYSDTTSALMGGTNASGSGTITTGAFSSGQATITGITGNINGVTIDNLLSPLPGFFGNNNILYYPGTSGYYIDQNGVSFLLSNSDDVNMYFCGPTSGGCLTPYYDLIDSFGGMNSFEGNFTLTPIAAPEPGTLTLLFAGLLALGLLAGVKRYRGSGPPIQV